MHDINHNKVLKNFVKYCSEQKSNIIMHITNLIAMQLIWRVVEYKPKR